MDKIRHGHDGDGSIRKNENKCQTLVCKGLSACGVVGPQGLCGLPDARPLDHPKGPDHDPDFGQMNREFRDNIRSRHYEEWD
ncbi:Hypothetical protein CINCED_3A019311 [Cinara cedri]|uniref:Uncharacterized protein n=1 Tax=Cinara cedri TaxID=506608 RepID=A0A5E4MP77_9HEMI|nr:Hypothetical protein CINCED_3A019311 [Cinara cedri]